jgi:ribosome-associated heat shock protein Hsp15
MASIRLDMLFCYLRFAKSRSLAQKIIASGYVRINGVRVEKVHSTARIGDRITWPQGQSVRVIQLMQLPVRRGAATEAAQHYTEIIEAGPTDRIDAAPPAQ